MSGEIDLIDQFQVLIMRHGWFEALGCLHPPPPPNLPQWLGDFRERVCKADLTSPKMQGISDNQFSKEFSKHEFGIDFTSTGVWRLDAQLPPAGRAFTTQKWPGPGQDPDKRGPDDLINIINASKREGNSGDNASLRKPYTKAREKTIKIFEDEGEEANCNAPQCSRSGPNCSKLKYDIGANQITIKVFTNNCDSDNYSVLYQLDDIRSQGSDLRNCKMNVVIKYGEREFNIANSSVSNKSLSKNVVLKKMMFGCKDILDAKLGAAAPDANDYKDLN